MKIKVITAYDKNYENIAKNSQVVLQKYCEKHGYQLCRKIITNFDRPAPWYKLEAILLEMEDDCEYLLWLDADTLILNTNKKIEEIITNEKFIFISRDKNFSINSGIFILKNNDYTNDILRKTRDLYSIYNENHPMGGIFEQAALLHLISKNYNKIREQIHLVDAHIMNAYDPETKPNFIENHVNKDSFILHLPNTRPDSLRGEIISKYISKYYK